jgi:hypothetical protein
MPISSVVIASTKAGPYRRARAPLAGNGAVSARLRGSLTSSEFPRNRYCHHPSRNPLADHPLDRVFVVTAEDITDLVVSHRSFDAALFHRVQTRFDQVGHRDQET